MDSEAKVIARPLACAVVRFVMPPPSTNMVIGHLSASPLVKSSQAREYPMAVYGSYGFQALSLIGNCAPGIHASSRLTVTPHRVHPSIIVADPSSNNT